MLGLLSINIPIHVLYLEVNSTEFYWNTTRLEDLDLSGLNVLKRTPPSKAFWQVENTTIKYVMFPAWLRRVYSGKTDFPDISRLFTHLNVCLIWMQSALWLDVWIFHLSDFIDILFISPATLACKHTSTLNLSAERQFYANFTWSAHQNRLILKHLPLTRINPN